MADMRVGAHFQKPERKKFWHKSAREDFLTQNDEILVKILVTTRPYEFKMFQPWLILCETLWDDSLIDFLFTPYPLTLLLNFNPKLILPPNLQSHEESSE